MWSPADPQALPSQEERKHAIKAITEIESQLKAAQEAGPEAQLIVDNLKEELFSRMAWIAPIRKLPSEILSEIFILAAEVESFAPVRISEVSRRCREVILGTPQAWSMIFTTNRCKNVQTYVTTFLERSKPYPLHLYFPKSYPKHHHDLPAKLKEVIIPSLYRIQCLSVAPEQLVDFNVPAFPFLARLTLAAGSSALPVTFLSSDRFPRLHYLNSEHCWLTRNDGDAETVPPPLRHLWVNSKEATVWVPFVQSCSGTLESLNVYIEFEFPTFADPVSVYLPRLRYLGVLDDNLVFNRANWPIQAVTPALLTYKEFMTLLGSGLPRFNRQPKGQKGTMLKLPVERAATIYGPETRS
ncbi:hypothetical protein M408DRAFT_25232 [Serendipita vermifera MAFF 305830]|uniref:F-box domain-containing protein n=1 Tax=Serendipita vermifera MAFF 305830 TaxID=933852 RepID=A0A0C2XBH9_SERVB|nr:hypothetical protein M408DRAFT_25232 [Serendipita vermifera MAFF 305830]